MTSKKLKKFLYKTNKRKKIFIYNEINFLELKLLIKIVILLSCHGASTIWLALLIKKY